MSAGDAPVLAAGALVWREVAGKVQVLLERSEDLLTVTVTDDGVGLPDGFDLDSSTGLGLSIVRTLVETELAGEIHMRRIHEDGPRRGTEVRVVVPTARF